jgi:hypothetical protein
MGSQDAGGSEHDPKTSSIETSGPKELSGCTRKENSLTSQILRMTLNHGLGQNVSGIISIQFFLL